VASVLLLRYPAPQLPAFPHAMDVLVYRPGLSPEWIRSQASLTGHGASTTQRNPIVPARSRPGDISRNFWCSSRR
jgi:hypothetical protein